MTLREATEPRRQAKRKNVMSAEGTSENRRCSEEEMGAAEEGREAITGWQLPTPI